MLKTKLKKLLALIMAGTMICGSIPAYAAETQFQNETEEIVLLAEEELAVSFDSNYAEVGKPLTASVTGSADVTYDWYIGGVQSGNHESSYTPTENDLEKWIEVVVSDGTSEVSVKTYFSKLPVVYIDTENGQSITSKTEYIDATIKIQGNSEYNKSSVLYEGATEIRGRGNSTWSQPKKPYKLKLDKKTNVFGMGKSKHWVLLANYLDESLMRNTLSYRLAGAMEMDEMSTVWVDVIMNGTYIGNYQLCENVRVDDDRVEITDWEGFAEDSANFIAKAEGFDKATRKALETYMAENMGWITSGQVTYNGVTYNIEDYPDIVVPDITGGYLLELDAYWDEVSKFKTESGQPIQFKSPEYVNTNSEMFEYVQEYVQAFEDAVQSSDYTAEYEGADTHYSDLYDLDALVDYWLVTEIFFNEEMNKKSTYMYKGTDGKMIMGPIWDMDWSSGAGGTSAGATNQWATNYFNINAQRYQWYKYLVKDPYFLMKLQERYWEIRDDQVQDMLDSMEVYYEQIKESGKADSKLWHSSGTFDSDYSGLKTWLNTHVNWMDQQMATEDSFDSSFLSKNSNLLLSLTDIEGNALPEDYVEKATADAFAGKSTDLLLHISGNVSGTAEVYINSRLAGTVALNGQEMTYQIAASDLTEELETKNVVEVKVKNNYGSVSASNYITVRQSTCDHSFGDTWAKNDTQHWKECANCQLQLNMEDHTFKWMIDKAATETENGIRHEECTVCGYAREAEEYEYAEWPESAEDDSKDLPLDGMTAISASEYPGTGNEGPDDLILDNNESTHWHTNYGAVAEGQQLENRWVGVDLEEPAVVCGIRCLPRSGGGNGTVTEYEVQYRTTDDEAEEWITVASGTWDYQDLSWKLVTFDPVVAKQVRIVGIHTYYSSNNNSQGDRHMSMAEFRVIGKAVKGVEEADKTILEEVLAEAKKLNKSDYTAESWETADLENIIAMAEAVFTDAEASQTDVDEAVSALKAAFEALVETEVVVIPEDTIPVSEMKATAGDSQEGEGAEKAIDENEDTLWHTDWHVGENHADHWLQLELNDVYEIDSFFYLPRQSGRNGIITEYEIYTSLDGKTWEKAAEGKWEADSAWKVAEFEPTEAKYVKLVTVEAISDQNILFASAAEVRLTGTKVETSVDPDPSVTVDKTELKSVIENAESLDPEDYKDFTEVAKALVTAKDVYADENADEDTVKAAVENLRKAIEALEEKDDLSGVKAELLVIIEYAESLNASDYVDFTEVEKALAAAKAVYADESATAEEVNEAGENLMAAIENLEAYSMIPEAKAELLIIIEYAESLNASDYVDFTEVEKALAAAKAVYADADATIDDVEKAYESLEEAIEKLEEKTETPVEEAEVIRLFGTDRYATGFAVADKLKEVLGVEKFDTVVIATGKGYADALSGSYLAAVKNAPILLTNGKAANVAELHAYIKANVKAGATIYVLGGEAAVSKEAATIEGYDTTRLSGANRYETNLAILAEAGVEGQEDLLVATGKDFADSLSASAAARPILLVKPGTALTDAQKAVAANFKNIYVIGGAGAVSEAVEEELAAYGTVKRLSGSSRYETSVKVAETFFTDPETVLLASGKNFPDGLCGGALAAALKAPLILTKEGSEDVAAAYVIANEIRSGYVLGGEGVLPNNAVVTVFGLESAEDIK